MPDNLEDYLAYMAAAATAELAIKLSPSRIDHTVRVGENLPEEVFTVTRIGSGTLAYVVDVDRPWLAVAPQSGSSDDEQDTVTITYSLSQLQPGTHHATIRVMDDGSSAPVAAQSLPVVVEVMELLADFDRDDDVDQSDYGVLQACFSDLGVAIGAGCFACDLNTDTRVDQADLEVFLARVSGPGIPAVPNGRKQ